MAVIKSKKIAFFGINRRYIRLIILAIFMAVLWYLYNWGGNFLRPLAVRQIAELTGAKVEINSFDFKLDGRVRIYGLSILPNAQASLTEPIIKVGRVDARFRLLSLLLFRPALKRIDVRDFDINIEQDTDTKQWNISTFKFKKPSKFNRQPPSVRVRNGSVCYTRIDSGVKKLMARVKVESGFALGDSGKDEYNFHLQSGGKGSNWITGKWYKGYPGKVILSGNISTAGISLFQSPLNIGNFNIDLVYDANDIALNGFSVNIGDKTNVDIRGRVKDYTQRAEFLFNIKAGNLPVVREPMPNAFVYTNTTEMVGGFIPMLQLFFDYFEPTGTVDIDVELSGRLSKMSETKCLGTINCKDSSIQFKKFPYRVENINGELTVTEDSVTMDGLKGTHNRVDVTMNGYSRGFGETWDCNICLYSDNMLLDDELYQALPVHYKKLWFAFSPSGFASGRFCIFAEPGGEQDSVLEAELEDVAIASQYFPYPIESIRGSFSATQDQCRIAGIKAKCNGGDILLDGAITEISSEVPKYEIHITSPAAEIDKWLDEDLIESFFVGASAEMISNVELGGKVNLDISVSNSSGEKPEYKILVQCLNNTADLKKFALPLKDITGKLIISADRTEIIDLAATIAEGVQTEAKQSQVRVNGAVSADSNGINDILISIKANDIAFDNRLGVMLAGELEKVYRQIAPTGRFDLDFEKIKMTSLQIDQKQMEVAGDVIFKNCSFGSDRGIDKFDGNLRIDGLYQFGSGVDKAGLFLTAKSMYVKDRPITNLKMPIAYDADEKILVIDDFVADCLGGKIIGSAKIDNSSPNNPGRYDFRVSFDGVDAAGFIRPSAEHRGLINGLVGGELGIQGNINDDASHIGRLKAAVGNLKNRKSGLVEKLQTVLGEVISGNFIFTDMVMDSYVKGRQLHIEQFSLYGPFFWLKGAGRLDLNTYDIDMTLTLYSFDSDKEPTFIESLVAGLIPALLKIEVTGNYSDPKIKAVPLPILKDSLGVIGTRS